MSRSGVLSRQSRPTTESVLPSMRNEPRHRSRDRIGPRRRAQRKGAALLGVMARRLQHQIAPRLVHPVEQQHVAHGFEAREALGPARIELDGADGVGLARVLRAILAPLPRRADAADEIERGVEPRRQRRPRLRPRAGREHRPARLSGAGSLRFGRLGHDGKLARASARRQRPRRAGVAPLSCHAHVGWEIPLPALSFNRYKDIFMSWPAIQNDRKPWILSF